MLRKLTKLVTNNLGLKVLGVVLAIILWMVIVNVEDPQKTATFSIPVQLTNTEYLDEMGKTYEVLDDTDVVTFYVSGNRSVIEKLSSTDFTATANMENIDESLTTVPIIVTATNYSNQLEITKSNSHVRLNVENKLTKEVEVQVQTDGNPAANCFVDRTSTTVKKVTVSGPESAVGTVDSAGVTLNVDGASKDVSSLQQIVLYDADGNELSLERLTLDETETTVTAFIRMQKSLQLEFEVTGTPASGYRSQEVESDISSINVVGETSDLSSLEILLISDDALNLSGVTSTVTVTIELEEYLPDGVKLADGEPATVTVTVPIESQTTSDVEMPTENLTAENLANGLRLSYNADTVEVHITGYEDEIERIRGDDLSGTVDASGLTSGIYTLPVEIGGTYADVASATVSVTITGTSENADNTETTGDEESQTGDTGTTDNNE